MDHCQWSRMNKANAMEFETAGVVLGDHFPPRYPSPCVFTAMSLQDDISQEYNEVFENFALQMEAASLVLYAFNSWCYQPTCAAY